MSESKNVKTIEITKRHEVLQKILDSYKDLRSEMHIEITDSENYEVELLIDFKDLDIWIRKTGGLMPVIDVAVEDYDIERIYSKHILFQPFNDIILNELSTKRIERLDEILGFLNG